MDYKKFVEDRPQPKEYYLGSGTAHTLTLTPTHRLVREKLYIGNHTEIERNKWKKRALQ